MYRGWHVTASTIVTQSAQAGLLIYGLSALVLPLEKEFGTGRAEVMLTATALSLSSSALAPILGRQIDRRSVRTLVLLACAALAAGWVAVSAAPALWMVWLAYAVLLAPANVLLGQMSSATLITRWFTARRGRAMGLSTLGTSIGGFIYPVLLASAVQAYGWRPAVLAVGLGTAALCAVVVFAWVVDRPSKLGLEPDEGRPALAGQVHGVELTTAQLLAKPALWVIACAIGIKLGTYLALVNNLAGYGGGLGVAPVRAAGLVAVLSVTSMIGKLLFGFIAERVALRTLFAGALLLTIVAFGLLLAARDYPSLLAACLLMGFATGAMLPIHGLIIGQYFGQASYGRALGLTNLLMVPFTASASPLAGFAYDRTGGYGVAIVGAIAVLTVAVAAIALLRPPSLAGAAAA